MGKRRTAPALRFGVALGALLGVLCLEPQATPAATPEAGDPARGAYLFAAGDCASCHTDLKAKGPPLAGGAPMATDFGTFFAPNISADKTNGIGAWSLSDFRRAMREGKGKGGEYLYPVFPYPAFTGMTDADIADLYAYLKTQAPIARPNRPQQAKAPYNLRPLLAGWRVLFFHPGPLKPVAGQSAEWNRGRYLAEAVVHCQECHTPRGGLGQLDAANGYAGNPKGPDGQKAPNISSSPDGLGKWSLSDLEDLLKSGQTPDGDFVGSNMALVVDGTGKLTPADRHAIAVYIKSLPAKASTKKG
jgi:mono/diheme cytochrome c family protein